MSDVAYDLNVDQSFIEAIWFRNKKEVINQLSLMMNAGWRVVSDGLVSESKEHGTVIAQPLKIKGNKESTGIGIFKYETYEI